MSDSKVPNFLYIGTSKAGSTWLFDVLSRHPQVHLPSDKGLYYFDAHFDRGQDWYLRQFGGAGSAIAVGEISHSYLSSPQAARRIASLNASMTLLVCLREPADRAFSDYLDLVKNKQFTGSFEDAVEQVPRLVDRGRYATHLRSYLEWFPREAITVQLFDDLRERPQGYADEVSAALTVDPIELPSGALRSRMPAGVPRSAVVARSAKSASRVAKSVGLRRARARVKRSVMLRQMIYRPFTAEDKPVVSPETAHRLTDGFAEEVLVLDDLLGFSVARRWGYL